MNSAMPWDARERPAITLYGRIGKIRDDVPNRTGKQEECKRFASVITGTIGLREWMLMILSIPQMLQMRSPRLAKNQFCYVRRIDDEPANRGISAGADHEKTFLLAR
jgi:hypothetical protein